MKTETTQTEQVVTEPNAEVTVESTETQQAPTQKTAVETDTTIQTNTDAVGLEKKVEEEDGGSQLDFNTELDGLVTAALADKLTDEQMKSLEEGGLKNHFDMIVEGHKAQQAAADNALYEVVGDKDSYSELQDWALDNLSDADVESFNNAVLKSGDIGVAKLAVEALNARYIAQNGKAPSKVVESGGSMTTSSKGYENVQDYLNESTTNKYLTDPEYAAEVEKKRALSGF